METLRFVFKNLDQFRLRFGVVFVIAVADACVVFGIPFLLSEFTKESFSFSAFGYLMGLVGLLYGTSLILQWIIRRFGESLGAQLEHHIRLKYFYRLEHISLDRMVEHHSGYVLSLLNRICQGVPALIFNSFWDIARGFTTLLLFFLVTARESVLLALGNTLILLFFVTLSIYLSGKMVPIIDAVNKKRAGMLSSYADFMSNLPTVQKLGIYDFVEQRLDGHNRDNFVQIQRLQNFHANRWFMLHTLLGAFLLGTIAFLLFQISQGAVSVAILILFITSLQVVRGNVERLSEMIKMMLELKTYVKNLEEILEQPVLYGNVTPKTWKTIRLSNIVFQYPKTEKQILLPEFVLERGTKVLLTGKSGSGKTTLLHLLSRYLVPQAGDRFVDKHSFNTLSRNFFDANFAFVSQEVELFNLSLRDNITFDRDLTEAQILKLLKDLDLDEWVKGLENGLETVVGEKGLRLSSGQKQRINLLRAVLLDREIYLLDEPTSHLDSKTEEKVIAFLKKRLAKKTVVIVSHREKLKALCNKAYTFRQSELFSSMIEAG